MQRVKGGLPPASVKPYGRGGTRPFIGLRLHWRDDFHAVCELPGRQCLEEASDGCEVGTFGELATFSCNHNNIHCCGEGGFLVSNDSELFERGRKLHYFGEHSRPSVGDPHPS